MTQRNRLWLLLTVLLSWLLPVVDAESQSSISSDLTQAPLSGCQKCANTGDCSHAYLDAPGQFCGNWLDRASQKQRCCCPRDATCQVSNYACNCRTSSTKQRTPAPATSPSRSTSTGVGAILGSILLLCIGSALLWCLCPCCRAHRYTPLSAPMRPVVVEAPAYAQPYTAGYGAGYGHAYGPGYGPAYGGAGYSQGGMGSGSSALLGGTAGFFGGMMLGQALSHSNDGGHHGYRGDNGYAGASGEEFGGDF